MPEYDPRRERARPAGDDEPTPVDALLDRFDGAVDPGAGDQADRAVPAAPQDDTRADPPALPGAEAAAPDAAAPAVTPDPVDPAVDRSLGRLGVIGAAVATAALITFWRRLRRRRRAGS